ncbi:MAG: hypothetical protein AB7J32_05795 [Pseudonocardia sp.]
MPARPPLYRWLIPSLLAAPMLAAMELTGHRDLLVPPALALAFGAWVIHRPDWTSSRWKLVAVPTLTSAIGVAGAWAPVPRWLAVAGVVTAALLLLQVACCRVGPAVAVAVLPVVFGIRGIEYVVAVAMLAATVAVVCPADGREPGRWPWRRLAAFWAAAVTWTVFALGVLRLPLLVTAPPMFVATLDFTIASRRPALRVVVRRCVLLAGAAMIGAACLRYVPDDVAGGTLAVAAAGMLAAVFGEPLAPAYALSLVPFVAEIDDPVRAGFDIALAAVALHLIAAVALSAGRERGRPGRVGPA